MKKILQEFKQFAMRGNVVDMAVGIIIGGAFGKIVSSVVADIIMPPVGLLIGGVNFSDLKITLKEAVVEGGAEVTPAVTLNYGNFIQTTLALSLIRQPFAVPALLLVPFEAPYVCQRYFSYAVPAFPSVPSVWTAVPAPCHA